MKEFKHSSWLDLVVLISTILVTILICNWQTPWLYNHIGGIHRTNLILEALNKKDFSPEIVVLGSSKSMMGIDAYQMTKELGVDVYNFSSTGQPPVESSLYYALLPNSVNTVVQIIYPPVKKTGEEDLTVKDLDKTIVIHFAMGGYQLQEEIKDINPYTNLSALERNTFLQNIEARAAIFIPGLTDALLPSNKEAAVDLKFCNSYVTERHLQYERTIDQAKKHSYSSSSIDVDYRETMTLEGYTHYLQERSIQMVIVLMPSNPDINEYTKEQMDWIGAKCKESIPSAIVLNYLSEITDPLYFYDAEHLNKEGAKLLTSLLDKDLINMNIVKME